jgi:hypothetical protein
LLFREETSRSELDRFPVVVDITRQVRCHFGREFPDAPLCSVSPSKLTFKNASIQGFAKGIQPCGALLPGDEILGNAFADRAHHFSSTAQVAYSAIV